MQGMLEYQHWAGMMAILPRLKLAQLNVVFTHVSAKSNAPQVAPGQLNGWNAARA